jgi:Tfp pilus assembly PilM family ATPase
MQAVSADLLGCIDRGETQPTEDSVQVLKKASDDLLTEIGRLIHRVTPSVRPPSKTR